MVPVLLTRNMGIGLDDMYQYDMLARSLANGNGYRWYAWNDLQPLAQFVDFDLASAPGYDPEMGVRTSFRAPLYPAFLALIYSIFGINSARFFAARVVQVILLSAPLAPLTYLIGRQIIPENEKAARWAALVVSIYPILILYPLGLGTENLFFILVLLAVYFLNRSFSSTALLNPGIASLLLGLAALTRSVIVPFALLAFLWLWKYRSFKSSVLAFISFVIILGPWVVRNSLLHDRLTGIESSLGYNLYLGYHPAGNGSFVFGPSLDLLKIVDDAERDSAGTQAALGFIRAQPGRVLPLAINRLGYFFGLEKRVLIYFYSNNLVGFIPMGPLLLISLCFVIPFMVLSVSAALGFITVRSNDPKIILLILLGLAYILPHVFILSEDRFHLVLVPFIAILAARLWAVGWTPLLMLWKDSIAGKFKLIMAFLICALLLLNWAVELRRDAPRIAALLRPDGNQTYFTY
jgi:hypothetical protein